MPEIDKSDVTNEEWLTNHHGHRFIRIEKTFYYSKEQSDNHASTAQENGVKEKDDRGRPIIDDGGFIKIINNKLAFGDFSHSCAYKGSVITARRETNVIAKEIFGEENIY